MKKKLIAQRPKLYMNLKYLGITHQKNPQIPNTTYPSIAYAPSSAFSLFTLHLGPIRISKIIRGKSNAQIPPQNV